MPIKVHITPTMQQLPEYGGVREHMLQIYKQFGKNPDKVQAVANPNEADILHVESAFPIPISSKPVLYTCHGGFIPHPPLPVVLQNLEEADLIVSVAAWMVERFFSAHFNKTYIIPNGVDLAEYDNLPESPLGGIYVLYGKEYAYFLEDYMEMAKALPHITFVSTVNFPNPPKNFMYIGLQSKAAIKSWIQGASALVLTGSEVCPTMLFEAWACRTPVVAKNVDGNREFMTHQGVVRGGMTYNVLKPHAISSLRRVVGRKESLGSEGRRHVEDLYNWNDLFKRYIKLYERLA